MIYKKIEIDGSLQNAVLTTPNTLAVFEYNSQVYWIRPSSFTQATARPFTSSPIDYVNIGVLSSENPTLVYGTTTLTYNFQSQRFAISPPLSRA